MDPNQPPQQPPMQPQQPAPQPMPQPQPAPQPQYAPQPQPGYAGAAPAPYPGGVAATASGENPERSYLIALFLSYMFGSIGVDRFYLGKTGSGVAKLLTFGGLGIWALIDLLLIAFGKLKAKDDNRPLEGFAKNYSWVRILAIVLVVINALVVVGIIVSMVFTTAAGIQDKADANQQRVDQMTRDSNSNGMGSDYTMPSDGSSIQ